MKDREPQPSGPNPEWEEYKEQNIAFAKRIENLLQAERPNRAVIFERMMKSGLENLEELNAIENIDFLKKQGLVDEEGSPSISREIQEALTNDDIEELTLGYTLLFSHVDNKYRTVVLGVGFSDDAIDSRFLIGDMIIGLPEDFAYPVYVVEEKDPAETEPGNDYSVLQSTKYGELPSNIIGANGLYYSVRNNYCFNLLGQGVKIEDIYAVDIMGRIREVLSEEDSQFQLPEEMVKEILERLEKEHEEEKRNLFHVDFIPEDGFRVIPLTSEDYIRVNKMLDQVEAGSYKFGKL